MLGKLLGEIKKGMTTEFWMDNIKKVKIKKIADWWRKRWH